MWEAVDQPPTGYLLFFYSFDPLMAMLSTNVR